MSSASAAFVDDQQKSLNIWWQGVLVLASFLALNLILYFLDDRLLGDEALWLKPIKFEISVIIHFITLAVLATLLSPQRRNRRLWKAMSYAVVAAGLFEVMYIFLQAARGRESHYNHSTPIEIAMYGLMGLGAVILVLGSFSLGAALYREYQSQTDNILLLSAALGLTLGSVLTLIIAGYLSSFETGYVSNSNAQMVLRLPLLSWYLNGQDLRIPHFLATHMMQLLPLYGLWLSRRSLAIADAKIRLYWAAASVSLLTILLFIVAIL